MDDYGIDAIAWHAGSPNLNPTEKLWDVLYLCIPLQVPPQTFQELTAAHSSNNSFTIWDMNNNIDDDDESRTQAG